MSPVGSGGLISGNPLWSMCLFLVALGVAWRFREPLTTWTAHPAGRQMLLLAVYLYLVAHVLVSGVGP